LAELAKTLIGYKDPLARAYLRRLIQRDLGMDGSVEAESFAAVVEFLRHDQSARIVLIDADLQGMTADVGLRYLAGHYHAPRFVVLFSSLNRESIERLIREGIAGCISKHLSEQSLVNALKTVQSGHTYVPYASEMAPTEPAQASVQQSFLDQELTHRQVEVLRLVALGHSNREIAEILNIAEGTVKVHVNAAFRVLGVHNRVSAAAAMLRHPDDLDDDGRSDG
jgi:DNA-binding NarL/FixJ family response regulator